MARTFRNSGHLTMPALRREDGSCTTDNHQRASLLLQHFFPVPDDSLAATARRRHLLDLPLINKLPAAMNAPFTMTELDAATSSLKFTAPGPDKIHNSFFSHLPPSFRSSLLLILNRSFVSGVIPLCWKTSSVCPIHKPGRPVSDPSSYRPISLSSASLKLLERLISTRLTWYLESKQIINPAQAAYRKGRSTLDHLITLQQTMAHSLAADEYLISFHLDLKGAFDNTWFESVLGKLKLYHIGGSIFHWINSYLYGRFYTLTINGVTTTVPASCGLPQGAVLSPLLFTLVVNDLPLSLPPSVSCLQFADDINGLVASTSLRLLRSRTQSALVSINIYCSEWGLIIQGFKSSFMLFSKSPVLSGDLTFQIAGENIPQVQQQRILGIVFDDKLTFSHHVYSVLAQCQRMLTLLRWLARRSWGASRVCLTRVYTSLIRSRMEYGVQAFVSCSPSLLRHFNVLQNSALRIILGAPKSTAIPALEIEAHLPPLSTRFLELQLRAYARYTSLGFTHLTSPPELFNTYYRFKYPALFHCPAICSEKGLHDIHHLVERVVLHPPDPPWDPVTLHVITDWLPGGKSDFDSSVLKSLFSQQLASLSSSHPIHFYTDGSKIITPPSTSLAFFSPQLNFSKALKIPPYASIYTAELLAILFAVQQAFERKIPAVIIISDSKSALLSLRNYSTKTNSVHAIRQLTRSFANIAFLWCPSHIQVAGNDAADRLATSAHASALSTVLPVPLPDILQKIRGISLQDWDDSWQRDDRGRFLHNVKPHPEQWPHLIGLPRLSSVCLGLLRLNRALFPTRRAEWRPLESPLCASCFTPSHFTHLFYECPEHERPRQTLQQILSAHVLPYSPEILLGGGIISVRTKSIIQSAVLAFLDQTVTQRFLVSY